MIGPTAAVGALRKVVEVGRAGSGQEWSLVRGDRSLFFSQSAWVLNGFGRTDSERSPWLRDRDGTRSVKSSIQESSISAAHHHHLEGSEIS